MLDAPIGGVMVSEALKKRLDEARGAGLALLGCPFDENSCFMKGAAEAPPLIREALFSDARNLWTESGVDLGAAGLLFDAGDVEAASWEEADARIEAAVSLLLERGLPTIALGGDHAITVPVVRALRRQFRFLDILHFDAHPDLYDEYKGSQSSNACPFARIMEAGMARRLVQVGIRTMNSHQRAQAERFGVEVIEMRDWTHGRALAFDAPLFVSIDMDALDPAHAPGVVHREPGGLTTRQIVRAIQRVEGRVVGADIVEFNPRQDPANVTAPVCAKLLKEIGARILEPGR